MTQLNQIYKCNVCGNIVEVVHTGVGELVCCGQPMKLQSGKTQDEGQEKHVPIIEKIDGDSRVKIKVGGVEHPMEEKHYIEWIEIVTDDRILKKYLKPGEKPEKEFAIRAGTFTAKAYCNVHGLWQSS